MATELQQAAAGHFMAFGPPDATLKVGTTSTPTSFAVMITSASFSNTAQRIKTANANGETVNITTYNQNVTATMTVVPTGSTRADAITSAIAMPTPGQTLYSITKVSPTTWTDGTNFSGASGTGTADGKEWSVVSCSRSGESGQRAEFTLVLEREGAMGNDYTGV